jgi:hypothetical protein
LKRWLAVALLSLLVAGGCSNGLFTTQDSSWNLFASKKKKPPGPEIASPKDRMKAMNELAKRAHSMSPDEQQRDAVTLAHEIQREEDPLIRAHIVKTLASFEAPAATAVVAAASRDPDAIVRIRCCEAWGHRGGAEARAALLQMAKDETDFDVRTVAVRQLGKLKDSTLVPELAELLDETDPALQYCAIEAMRDISGKDFGDSVDAWRDFAKGGSPPQISVADKIKRRF